jgi:uncharacterized protein YgbK (DUF1537 family)
VNNHDIQISSQTLKIQKKMRIAVIADDLTGALDTGVQFHQWGYKVHITDNLNDSKAEITILNTDTRNKTPETAYKTTYHVTKKIGNYDIIYKKTDSTLRGNPGPELQAILDATGERKAILSPTYPKTGRRVKNGHLYIENKLITDTDYIHEYRVKSSYIPEIVITKTLIHHLKNAERVPDTGIIVLDSETEQDLLKILNNHPRIIAGSAGLADALCQVLRNPPPVLTIIGSIRTETRKQAINLSQRLGAAVIPLDFVKALKQKPQNEAIQKAKKVLSIGHDVIIISALSQKIIEETRKEAKHMRLNSQKLEKNITESLADTTKALLNHKLSGIIMTGGATALAIIKRLNVKNIEILDEVQPGIPVLKLDNLPAISKAGGFGVSDALIHATQYLKRRHR